jgi:hypothetical protein
MKCFNKKNALVLVAFAGMVGSVNAAITPVSFNGTYTQNFDSLGTGTSLASLPEWAVYSLSGSHDTFSYASTGLVTATFLPWSTPTALNNGSGSSTLTNQTTLTVDTFTTTTQAGVRAAGGFNFASTVSPYVSTDHALGTSPTGTAGTELQLSLVNNTGSDLNSFNISYDIRRFSTTTNNNNDPSTDPYVGEEELPGYSFFYSLDGGATWNNVASLTPQDLTGAPGTPSGGPLVPNSVGVTNVPTTAISLVSPWTSGSLLEVRWFDDNAESPSPDQNLGLDNVVVSTGAVPEPTAIGLLGVTAAALLRRRSRNA